MSRKRLLLFVDSLSEGRSSSHIEAILGRLSRRAYDVRVMTLFGSAQPVEEIERARVKSYHLALPNPSQLAGDGIRKVRHLVGGLRYDIVHTHGPYATVVGPLVAGDAAVVSTLHEVGDADTIALPLDVRFRKFAQNLLSRGVPPVFLATTEALRARAGTELGLPDVRTLPAFVDVARLGDRVASRDRKRVRTRLGIRPDDFAVLHAGDFDDKGRQDRLLEAFRTALREHPDLRLFLAGTGPTLADARGLAEELDLGDSAVFLGRPPDRSDLLAAADVFVQPTRDDAFPHAVVEALAAGVPAVVASPGLPAELLDTPSVILADADREDDLARALLDFARSPERRKAAADSARAAVMPFDVGRWIGRLEDVYAGLDGPPASPP